MIKSQFFWEFLCFVISIVWLSQKSKEYKTQTDNFRNLKTRRFWNQWNICRRTTSLISRFSHLFSICLRFLVSTSDIQWIRQQFMFEREKKLEWKRKNLDSLFCYECFKCTKIVLGLFQHKRSVTSINFYIGRTHFTGGAKNKVMYICY